MNKKQKKREATQLQNILWENGNWHLSSQYT